MVRHRNLPRYLPRNISGCSLPCEPLDMLGALSLSNGRRDPDRCAHAQGYTNPPIVARSGSPSTPLGALSLSKGSGTKGRTCETLTRSPCAPTQGYDRVSSASNRANAAAAVPKLGSYEAFATSLHRDG